MMVVFFQDSGQHQDIPEVFVGVFVKEENGFLSFRSGSQLLLLELNQAEKSRLKVEELCFRCGGTYIIKMGFPTRHHVNSIQAVGMAVGISGNILKYLR